MKLLPGRIQNGVVVLNDGQILPEGLAVTVLFELPQDKTPAQPKGRIEFPLVKSAHPGSVHLTGELIGEILDAEDAAPCDPGSGSG